MHKRTFFERLLLTLALVALLVSGVGPLAVQAQDPENANEPNYADKAARVKEKQDKRITTADRKAAAERAAESGFVLETMGTADMAMPGESPRYFSHPNYANSPLPGNIVSEWNAIAQEILQPASMSGMPMSMGDISMATAFVYLSYMQAAVYDVLVAIEGGYQPYAYQGAANPDASHAAAVATAAYTVLKHYLPDEPTLDGKYAASLGAVPDGLEKTAGIALGQDAAAAIIALRAGDGLLAPDTYTVPPPGPGVWEPAVLPDTTVVPPVDPWMAFLRPFLRTAPDQYRPGPPPDLASPEYAADLNEVKGIGGAVSALRTPEQTQVAMFWTTNMVIQTNVAYRQLAASHSLSLIDTARLMAMGNMVACDSLIATFDAKYHYNFWRPLTAIPRADTDGNDATVADPTWMPAVMTPNFPEYVAGHGSYVSAQAEVYTKFFGTPQIEIDLESSVTGTTRHYATADDMRTEIVNARTWGGLHFRNSSVLAVAIGQQLVADALASHFLPDPASAFGNPLVDRAYASDLQAGLGELAPIFVVLPGALPAGTLTGFQTWNQAKPAAVYKYYLPIMAKRFDSGIPTLSPASPETTERTMAGTLYLPSAGNVFHAYVLRPTETPGQYTVLFDSGLLTVPALADPAVSELAVFPVTLIEVRAGDVIAFYGQGIPVDMGGGDDIVSSPVSPVPALDDTITLGDDAFPLFAQDRTYSFGALVDSRPHETITGGIRKFVDGLPGLTATNANNLGQYIPVGIPETVTIGGQEADYYEIAVVQYREQMHSDLPPTLLRGYVQVSTAAVPGEQIALTNALLDGTEAPTGFFGVTPPHYLGPTIVATKDRPVRIKFYNLLPTGIDGDLFIPVDTTVMGAGMTPDLYPMEETDPQNPMCGMAYDMLTGDRIPKMDGCYTENRATLHLHGGISPWISDGTPHQWITPAGESTAYPQGVSVRPVPDMGDSGDPNDGIMTFYYTNQQSARLMFYHDHSWGITRLNVYAGGAAPYLITDDTEQSLISQGLIPGADSTIPLVVQDKTFVPPADQLAVEDETWDTTRWGGMGNLWLPHVYSPAQNPGDSSGVNQFGRWAYGPWFWPPTLSIDHGPVANPYYDPLCDPDVQWCEPPMMPGTPYNSMGMEAFMDTPVINGTAYPTLEVEPKAYRFRVLNAANDRFFNLSFYQAADALGNVCDTNNLFPVPSPTGVTCTEVLLNPDEVAAALDDPTIFPTPLAGSEGPSWVQIGTEGGFLPSPAVVPAQFTTWVNDPTVFNAGNVDLHSLLLGPAERADVIVDFSAFAGQTLILYNDAPAAFPARDPRYDYYTGDGDFRDTGGTPPTLPGYGPNIRTVMQIRVAAAAPAPAFDLTALETAFKAESLGGLGVFENSQHPIVVGQGAYNSAYGTSFQNNGPLAGLVQIFDTSLTFKTLLDATLTMPLGPKQIQDEMGEAFDPMYGRMSGFLGLETPNAQAGLQNMILYGFAMPPTEVLRGIELPPGVELTPIASADDGSLIWKVTHNGVDTHPLHFHLYDVQLINRVGWDGIIRKPDASEIGWKDTVRISPLEDTIVALRPLIPTLPWDLPNSVRLIDPSMPEGVSLTDIGMPIFDPLGNPVEIFNHFVNFGWEYVMHCHILSHEEMDMMRPQAVGVTPKAPTDLALGVTGDGISRTLELTWVDNSINETEFTVQRAFTTTGPWETLAVLPADTTLYTETVGTTGQEYAYRVFASNTVGDTELYPAPSVGFPTETMASEPTNIVELSLVPLAPPAAPTDLTALWVAGPQVRLTWTDNATDETGFFIERAEDGVTFSTLANMGANIGTGSVVFTDTTVISGTIYTYQVAAENVVGPSGYSNTATAP